MGDTLQDLSTTLPPWVQILVRVSQSNCSLQGKVEDFSN